MAPLDLPPARVFVKHNFVPQPEPAQHERNHSVAYVGRLDAAKGVPLLMRAWDTFRLRYPTSVLRLTVAGGGPLEDKVRSWASGHPSVDVLGLVPRAEAGRVLARSLAVLVPSQWEETFGLVAVEAMAVGVTPVAPAAGSFPELVDDGVDGVLFAPGSTESLAEAIARVDVDPARHLRMGAQGSRTYERRFTREVGLARLLEIYSFASTHPVAHP